MLTARCLKYRRIIASKKAADYCQKKHCVHLRLVHIGIKSLIKRDRHKIQIAY